MLRKILWSIENIILRNKIIRISRITKKSFDDSVYYNRKRYVIDHFNNKIKRIY